MSGSYFQSRRAFYGGRSRQSAAPDRIDQMPLWRQLQAAGAPAEEVERFRLEEALYGEAGAVRVAETLGLQPLEKEREGSVSKILDYLTRPGSYVVGMWTGYLGIDRAATDSRPEETGEGLKEALDRGRKAWLGQEKYRANDFGALVYDEDDGKVTKAGKFLAGLALDTIADPLTYVSGPGSLFGRRVGSTMIDSAVMVAAKKATASGDTILSRFTASQKEDIIRRMVTDGALDSKDMQSVLRYAELNKIENIADRRVALAKAADEVYDIDMPIDKVIEMAVSKNLLDDLVADALAAGTAKNYVIKGFGGARRTLVNSLGSHGEELWKMLPNDLQGGLRVRMPFVRKLNKDLGYRMPLTYIVPGTGGGRLLEKAVPLQKMADLANYARHVVRTAPGSRTLLKHLSGREGKMFYDMAADAYGRKVGGGAITYRSYANKLKLNASELQFRSELNSELGRSAAAIASLVRNGRNNFGDAFLSENGSTGRVQDMLQQADLIDDAFIDGLDNELDRAAARTVSVMTRELDRTAGYIEMVIPDFTRLEADFFPRIFETFQKMYYGRKVVGGGKGTLDKQRTAFAALFDSSGKVIRWRTPKEIKDLTGVEIFTEDPVEAMLSYLLSVRQVLGREHAAKELINRGIVGNISLLREVPDLDAAVQNALVLRNRLIEGSQSLAEAAGNREAYEEALMALLGPVGFRNMRAEALAALRSPALAKLSKRETIKLLASISQWGRGMMDHGFATPSGRKFFDGSSIVRRNGGFMIRDGRGHVVSMVKGSYQFGRGRRAALFSSEYEASEVLKNLAKTRRDLEYKMLTDQTRDSAEFFIADSIRRIEEMSGPVLRGGQNAFHPDSIPPHLQEEYFEALVDIMHRFQGKVKFTRWEQDAKKYRELIRGEDGKDIFASVGTGSSLGALPGIVTRMRNAQLFAPAGLIDSINRMFRVREDPTGIVKFFDDYYRPFYALQKSLMTAQRGPGYHVRNVIGGMWNAYLTGVNGRHFAISAKVQMIKVQAVVEAKREARKEATDPMLVKDIASRLFEESFSRRMIEGFGQERGAALTRAFVAWETYLNRGTGATSRQTGISASEKFGGAVDFYGDMMIDEGRGVIKIRDVGKVQRAMIWLGQENPWARVMTGAANEAEDYLRFAAFLRGTEMFGLEDGGFAASLMVKASQFDYSDLSEFEMGFVKMIVPFYTWTRNNVPLQFRALVSEPGKVNRAIRLHESLGGLWGEEDDPESPIPSYVRDRFGWTVRPEIYETAKGDQIAVGLVWGDPLSDVNRLFRAPRNDGEEFFPRVNWREIINMLNPMAKSIAEGITQTEAATGAARTDEEEAPVWALPFARQTPDGKRVVSSRMINFVRENFPTLGIIERVAPELIGNERYRSRAATSRFAAMTGLPVSTLDAFQQAGELRARQRRLEAQMQRAVGETLTERAGFARELLRAGVTDSELDVIESEVLGGTILEVPLEKLNPTATSATIRFLRYIAMLDELGYPRSTLLELWGRFEPPKESTRPLARALTAEELASQGLSPEDVLDMTEEERKQLLRQFFD